MKMATGILEKVKKLVQKVKVVYVATANREGIPHIAASKGMAFIEDQIVFRAWFCLKTVENLRENPKLSLAVLNAKTKEGYQLLGEVERIEKGAILDGYTPEEEKR
jgi:general stress protein 26